MGSQYKSLLGLQEIAVDSLNIANLDLTNTNIIGLNTDRVPEDADPVNLYFTNSRFDTRLATKSTTDIKEGTNLYYTDGRFDTRLATKSTTNLAEGTNLYYTTARANTDFDARLATKSTTDLKEGTNLYYTTARFDSQLATKSTTNLAEGTNLYYTTARANTDFDTRLATKSTTNLAEGTNLYYTTVRANTDFDTRIATKSTTNLAEGTNLYYTTARANTDFDTRLATKSTTNLAEGTNLYYTNARFDTQLATKSTTNLAEGTNLYYTTARANTDFDTRLATKSIDALSDCLITTPANGQLLSYNGTNWVNATGSSTYLALAGGTMSGGLNMGGQSITNVNLVDGVDVSTLDTSVVKLTGDQTIAGNKKFTSTIEVRGATGPAAFDGIGIAFDTATNIGEITAQKIATAAYYPIQITGSYVDLYAGDNIIATATGTTLSLNNRKITNLATPTATTDGANKSYVDTLDGQNVKLTGNQTVAGIKTYSSGLEITGNSTNATTRGVFVVFNSTSNIGTIGCLNMATGVNYNFELNAKKVSFVIDGAIVGWVNASGLDCNSSKIANLGTPTLSTDGATKGYVDTLDGQNVKLTGDQTITGIKIFNGSRNDIRALNLLSQADFNNVDIINGGNITYNGARILNQNGGDIFFSQTTGDWQSFLYTLNTASSGTADQRGYVFTNVAFDSKGAGLYISKLSDSKFMSSDIVRFNNAGGMKFYGALDMNSNNITSGGTIAGTTITGTTITASTKITTATGKPIIIGNTTKGTGPSAGLEIYGAYGDFTSGPHIQAITTEDTYPLFTIANLGHNNIILAFDAYLDNAGWKSSYANANFRIAKVSNTLSFGYKSGIVAGSAITWSEAMNIDNAGLLTTLGITANDKITTALGKPIIIGRTTKGVGASGGLELYGQDGSVPANAILTGPHIQAFTTADAYPLFQQLNWSHGNINLVFDGYYDGTNWKSSSATSNFMINKGTNLTFQYASGITAGSNITWTEAMNISTAGLLTAKAGITYTGTLTSGASLTGARLTIQGGVNGGNTRGIFIWDSVDSNWGIYMAQSGANRALSGTGTAPAGNGFSSYAVRFRTGSDTTHGFVWENGSDAALMSLRGSDGYLWCNGGISTTALSTSASVSYAASNNFISLGPRTGALEPMILLKSSTNANNRGFFGYSGTTTYAWSTSNSSGENSGAYNYIPLNGAWTYSSDRRLKSDIKTLECGDCCEKLMKINCCSYYLKSDEKKENKNCGFIADEVKKIFPEFVSDCGMKADDGGENLEGITYTSFIPILISAFQHVAEKVVNLEKENKILLNILQDQTNQLAELRAAVFPSNAP